MFADICNCFYLGWCTIYEWETENELSKLNSTQYNASMDKHTKIKINSFNDRKTNQMGYNTT